MTSLWEALGEPPPDRLFGGRRCRTTSTALAQLHRNLVSLGCYRRFHSPLGIWTTLHPTLPANSLTWKELCGQSSLYGLIHQSLNSKFTRDLSVNSWNARWIVDPHTQASRRKRMLICRAVLKRRIVGLTETH